MSEHEEAVRHLTAADRKLARVIQRIGPCGLEHEATRTPFRALVTSIAYQQLNGKAAETILGRVKALYPGKRFPSPEDLLATPEERLRGAGLSRAKAAAVLDIARKTLDGVVPNRRIMSRLKDEEIIERLTVIRGVGSWTVEMLLIFTLGRTDVLPVNDFGVRKGFARTYSLEELPKPAELLEHGEKWRPYRSIAAWYLWRAADEK